MDIGKVVDFNYLLKNGLFFKIVKTIVITIIGYILARYIPLLVKRILIRKFEQKVVKFFQNITLYTIAVITVIIVLRTLDIEITTLLATAGLVSIAVGFAAQTAFSNLISGMLLYSEKPFEVGDIIEVDNNVGYVESIDLLSTKIRTFDNLFIRIPNAFIIDKAVKNYTRFPVRRLGIIVNISISSDLSNVKRLIEEALSNCSIILSEPRPQVVVEQFSESGVCLRIFGWIEKSDYYDGLSELIITTKSTLDKAGIDVLFPQRVITITDDSDTIVKTYQSKKTD
ncbi:MAG: mechanosensitive ion channel family protein [bacterium]